MIARGVQRATTGSEADALAALALIMRLDDRASYGKVSLSLRDIAASMKVPRELAQEARALEASLLESMSGEELERALGVVTHLAVLGPFRDTGGGLSAHDGPEADQWNPRASYAWGTIDVRWRTVPQPFAHAAGVPLDVFVHPRKESCTWVASEITPKGAGPVFVRVAATGQVRLVIDGTDAGQSEEVHAQALFDRLAAKIEGDAAPHLVGVKVCAGALEDAGRVRIRITDAQGKPVPFQSATPSGLRAKRSSATAITSPLERALRADPKGTSALLAAATIRRWGGADDLRSPKSGGLLDAATRDRNVTADELAYAGFLSASAAHRSGWLHLARARAEASQDQATMAFVDRRSVEERVGSQLTDWAMATARAAQLDAGKDAEATFLFALVEESLGTEALRRRAYQRLTSAAPSLSVVPTSMLERTTALAFSFDRNAARNLAAELGKRRRGATLQLLAAGTKDGAATLETARRLMGGVAKTADTLIEAAAQASAAATGEAQVSLWQNVLELAPNRSEAWTGFAHAAAAVPALRDRVTRALARARDLAPGDERIRSELALRAPAAQEPKEDERYLVASDALLSRRQGVPQGAPDVAERQLYWLRAVKVHPDFRVSQLIHYAREIVVPPRTQNELFENIPPEGDLVEILRARVHRKDGGTAFPTEEHNSGFRPRIRWPELMPGDTVEVAIRTWTEGPVGGRGDAPYYFLDYAGSTSTHPLLYNEVIVDSVTARPIHVDVIGKSDHRREEKDVPGRHITRLVWDKPAVVREEPLAPSLSETVPVVVGSTFRDWDDFRKWYRDATAGFTEPDDEVRRLAKELTRGKTTRDAKIRALFNFVADDIRYVNYVSGEWWLPNRPSQLLARREGDCDDKAMLLITLLKSVGIEAEEVLVQTRLTNQPTILRAAHAAVPLFDHGIAFVRGPGGGQYLDATSPQSRVGPVPAMDARASALRMDGPAEIVNLPASSPAEHGAETAWNVRLEPDGSAVIDAEEQHMGDSAFWLRTYLSQADARAQYVESMLLGWLPTVELERKVEFDGAKAQGGATLRYRARSQGYARREGGDLVLPLAATSTLTSQLAPLGTRTLPVALPADLAPSHQSRTLRIQAPAGFRWAAPALGGVEREAEFGRAELSITQAGPQTMVVRRQVVFDQHLIPPSRYAQFRAWLQRVDALMNKQLRLEPQKGVSP